jgi:hypothetical protein
MQNNNNNFGTAGLFNEGNNNNNSPRLPPKKPNKPILENKKNNKQKSFLNQARSFAKSASISAYSTLKSTGNSSKNLAQKKVLESYGYNNGKNYNQELSSISLSPPSNNTLQKNIVNKSQGIINSKRNFSSYSIENQMNIAKSRGNDPIVLGYNKLLIFNKEINKIIKEINSDINKYDNLEKKNIKYHSFLQPYLEEISKKQSHNNKYYTETKGYSESIKKQAIAHNKNKEAKTIKYAKFYLYKIFNNLSEILTIKRNIESKIRAIDQLYNNNKTSVIDNYINVVKDNISSNNGQYQEYILRYNTEFKGIIEKPNKNQKINKLKNYYNENPSELKKNNKNNTASIARTASTNSLSSANSANSANSLSPANSSVPKKGWFSRIRQ